MRLTRRGIVVLLAAAALTGFVHAAVTEEVPAAPAVSWEVDTFEDGSGFVLRDGVQVATVPEGILPWDCTENGNLECGPEAPQEVRGFRCSEFVVGTYDVALRACTDGSVMARPATDVDAEGEVI